MLKSKTTFFVFAVVFFIAASCNKEKKMGETLSGTTWEITSLTINDVEKLDQFYEDSCLPKILKFKSPGLYQSLTFSGFNPSKYTGEIKTEYNITKVKKGLNKEYFIKFKGFTLIDPSCNCGRFGTINQNLYEGASNIKFAIDKKNIMTITMIQPESIWKFILKLI